MMIAMELPTHVYQITVTADRMSDAMEILTSAEVVNVNAARMTNVLKTNFADLGNAKVFNC